MNQSRIALIGHYPYVFGRTDSLETVAGLLDKRAPHPQHINKLLGCFNRTHWPETASYAPGHNYQMIMRQNSFHEMFFYFKLFLFVIKFSSCRTYDAKISYFP